MIHVVIVDVDRQDGAAVGFVYAGDKLQLPCILMACYSLLKHDGAQNMALGKVKWGSFPVRF